MKARSRVSRRRALRKLDRARSAATQSYRRDIQGWLKPFEDDVKQTYLDALRGLDDATEAQREAAYRAANKLLKVRYAKQVTGGELKKLAKKYARRGEKVAAKQWQSLLGVQLNFITAEMRREFIDYNVSLIKSIATRHLEQSAALIQGAVRAGTRHEVLARGLTSIAGISKSRAKLIARDQTTTYLGQLTKAAHKDAGVTHYTWTTAGDGDRVRPEHAELEGETFSYEKGAPSLGGANPGDEIQCRCFAFPVVDFDV